MENGKGQNAVNADARTELPEAIRLGEQLRAIRESKGLSLMQITEQLDIRSYLLNDMEKGRFAHLRLGDCLAYAKLLGVNVDLVKTVHSLAVAKKAQDADSNSKLKLYVGVGVMVAAVMILCLLLSKSNDATPAGAGLIEMPATSQNAATSLKEEPIDTAPAPASIDEGNLDLEEVPSDASANGQNDANTNQGQDLGLEEEGVISVLPSDDAKVVASENIASENLANDVVTKVDDSAIKLEEQAETVSVLKNPNVQSSTLEKATSSEVSNNQAKTQDKVQANSKTQVKAESAKHNSSSASTKPTTKPATSSKSVSNKTVATKLAAKPTTNTQKANKATPKVAVNNSQTTKNPAKAKPLAYGEVRSLADEMGIKPAVKSTNTAPAQPVVKAATQVKNANSSTNGPKVVSPQSNSSTTLKAGEIKSLSKE